MLPAELQAVLQSDPEIMGGSICFIGTRIPVAILLDNVAAGTPLNELFDNYPSLTPATVQPVLDWENKKARETLGLGVARSSDQWPH